MKKIFLALAAAALFCAPLYAQQTAEEEVKKPEIRVFEDKEDSFKERMAMLINAEDYAGIENEINRALARDPDLIRAYLAQTYLYIRTNRINKLIGALEKLIDKDKENEAAYRIMKAMFTAIKKPKKAIKESNKILKKIHDSPDAHYIKAASYSFLLKMKKAEKNLDKAQAAADKKNFLVLGKDDIYYLRGNICCEFGDYDGAMRNFSEVGKYNEANSEMALAITYIEKKDYDSAQALVAQLLDAYPDDYTTYYAKGNLEYVKEEYGEAILSLNRALRLNSMVYEAYYYLAGSYIYSEQFAYALEALKKYHENSYKAYVYKDDYEGWISFLRGHADDENAVKAGKFLKSKLKKTDRVLKK